MKLKFQSLTALTAKVVVGCLVMMGRWMGGTLRKFMANPTMIVPTVRDAAAQVLSTKIFGRTTTMPATTEGLDRVSEVIENHINNRKLYDPDGARMLAVDWINLRAEMLRAIVERDERNGK